MKKLVIHPADNSTAFLKPIYEGRNDVDVVTGGVSREQLMDKVSASDQVILLGHGSPDGLLSVGQFEDAPMYVVDDSFAPLLAEKDNTVFIWCFADRFVERNKLKGCGTGMFISEPLEAWFCGLTDSSESQIDESNHAFVDTVRRFVDKGAAALHEATRAEYGRLALCNPVAAYNHSRLHLSVA